MFLQQLFNGLSVGSIYALMAVGYSLIYSLLNFTNFAHSLTVTLGAFVAFFVTSTALQNLTVGILAAVAVAGAAAMLIQKTAYSPLLKKNVRRIYLTIAGLGTVTIGENLMIIGFTGRFRAYPVNFSSDMISIFGASVGEVDLIIFLLSVVALVAVEILIQKTIQRLILTVFLVAGSLAGLAGALLGAKYTAYPTLGASMTNKAFVSAVVGGLGSIPGAVVGAMILGIGETMIAGYISSSLRDLFAYMMLVIILIVRPVGIMGRSSEDKA